MKLTNTKGALRVLETIERPGADRILSLMAALVDDVYHEANAGLCDLDMVSKSGNEEGFLDALDKVALELADLMDEIDAGKMPDGLRVYTNTVLDSKDHVRKLSDTTKAWKELEQTCQKVNQQIAEETKKLEEQKSRINDLEHQLADLRAESADALLTEEGCRKAIEELQKELKELPGTTELSEHHRQLNGQRKRYAMVNQYISDYIEDHDENTRLAQKFELSEETCRNDLQTVDHILRKLEQHYGKMLQFMETQRIERENDYAGN